MLTLLKNVDTIITCDPSDSVLHHRDIWFHDGIIASLNGMDAKADVTFDGSNLILYPGLVNTHHHLYQYFTRNLKQVQGFELFDWLKALYEIWKNLNEDTVRLSSLCGMGELMRYGCTTCFDHHYVFPSNGGDLVGAQFEAAKQLGIRMHASRGSMDLSKKDGGLPPDAVVQTVDEILKDSERLVQTYHDPSPFSMQQMVLAPCSPFSVSKTLLKESATLARKLKVQLHTHLCETKDEEQYTLERYGMRPFDYMESLDWVGEDVFYAHGIHFNDSELERIAKTGSKIAHCPCSNMKLSSGTARIPDMQRLGITVGLAVDGSASNDASNLLEEIRSAYLLHRLVWGSDSPCGYDLLKMATVGSAKVLGRTDIGSIEVGKAADVFAISKENIDLVCAVDDPKELFGTVGYHRPCDLVFVNGRCTVKNGSLQFVNEQCVMSEAEREAKRLLNA